MKRTVLFLSLIMVTLITLSQSPDAFNYQAVLRDGAGNIRAEDEVIIEVSILAGSVDAVALYTETHNVTTNSFGLINLLIGKGTVVSGNFNSIDWSGGLHFIKISVDETEFGTSQLLSVPYAKYADKAGNFAGTSFKNLTDVPVHLDTNLLDDFSGNFNDLTNVPENLDTNSLDDFNGSFNNLANVPVHLDTNSLDDFSGNYNYLTNKPNIPDSLLELITDAGNKIITHVGDPVNQQDAVTKAYIDKVLRILIENMNHEYEVTDYDTNVYHGVKIGNQVWLAENLKAVHYSDGSAISGVYAYNNDEANAEIYGRLYTWDAIMKGASSSSANPSGVQGVCPSGWHLPSDAEWKELEMFLGMSMEAANASGSRGTIEGGKLKEAGTAHWIAPNTEATDEYFFTLLPAADRNAGGGYNYLGLEALLWSCTENGTGNGINRKFPNASSAIIREIYISKNYAISARCIKD